MGTREEEAAEENRAAQIKCAFFLNLHDSMWSRGWLLPRRPQLRSLKVHERK